MNGGSIGWTWKCAFAYVNRKRSPPLAITLHAPVQHLGVARSILVVDDNQDVREWMGAALLEAGHNVTLAADGAEALEEVTRGHFDVVVTDIVMPNRDGFELIGDLRHSWPDIRIIVVSGDGRAVREGYLQNALGLGAHVALGKPFGVTKLRAALATALSA